MPGVRISRKTGYKIFDRYQECIHGLTDRRRRPYRYANQLPFQVENYILNVKHEHPSWGARKIRERLLRRLSEIPLPAKSTIHAVLDRHGLVEQRGRRRRRAQGTPSSLGQRPNELWCIDYKGEFLLGNPSDPVAYAIAQKQLYASHYFETALDLSFCIRGSDDSKQPGFYLIMAMGSEQAGLTGVKGSIVRKTAVGRSPISRRHLRTLRPRWKATSRRSQ